MNQFQADNLRKLLTEICGTDNIQSNEANIDKLKYLFSKSKTLKQTELLTKLFNNIENDEFLEMIESHIDILYGTTDEELVKVLSQMSEGWTRSKDIRIFTFAEAMIAGQTVSSEAAEAFAKISNKFFYLTNDPHFRLFADYSKAYSSNNKEELNGYLSELRHYHIAANSYSDKYYTLYLICLCLQRICIIESGKADFENIDREYGEFFARNQFKANLQFEKESDLFYVDEEFNFGCRSFELVPYGSGHHSVTLDFEKIFACSFPAICRLFVTNYHHFSQNVENELTELCRVSKDAAKYNKRETILISEKTSFCLYNV